MAIPARFFRSTDELRSWFEAHHADTPELWIGFYKAHSGRSGVVYPEAVDEALCFGWIDTTVRRIDDDRYANRFVPRRAESQWSEVNRRRYAELDRAGRIHEAGRRAFERRPTGGRPQFTSGGTYRLNPDFAARLRAQSAADRYFRSRPQNYRKRATFWVMSAALPETRNRRFVALLEASASQTIPRALLLPGESAPPPARPGAAKRAVRPRAARHRQRASGRR
ncbi:MAG TPA: YdeI/OmpD-associated family protein [Thermoplasmata archaeon]|nr:YdeI/OmpD-associated family protein [Thermoplasmata archaeon]